MIERIFKIDCVSFKDCKVKHIIEWKPDFSNQHWKSKFVWIIRRAVWKIGGKTTVFDWWREVRLQVGIFASFEKPRIPEIGILL